MSYYPITGRINDQKQVFYRHTIKNLEINFTYQWTLFVLGWAYIKGTPIPFPDIVHPPLPAGASYMEIGGIHGKPYREWAGDKRTPEEAEVDFSYNDKKDMNPFPSRFGGYCHHAAITFPTWHRPYLLLVEQAIGEYAENIAQQIEDLHPGERGLWVKAAKELRFPYWDWADPKVEKQGFPPLFFDKELKVIGLGRKYITVPNPLATFMFPSLPGDFNDITYGGSTSYFSKWKETYRYCQSVPDPTGSDIAKLQSDLKKNARSIRENVGMLFTYPDAGQSAQTYDEFSNTRNQSRSEDDHSNRGSLEGVHNSIHDILGGNGHMAWPDYAGFDPIFFFHHCNVDRLEALWDWCYPQHWMGDGYVTPDGQHRWTIAHGTYSLAYSQMIEDKGEWGLLVPFRHSNGDYWTSKEARFFTKGAYPKYYSYKNFVEVDREPTSVKERQEVRAKIAKYYGVDPQKDASTVHTPSWRHIPVPEEVEANVAAESNFVAESDAAVESDEVAANLTPIKNFRIFRVLVRLLEHAVGGTYRFELYYKEELVGSVSVFAREDQSPCKGCAIRRTEASVVRGVITIPSQIVDDVIVHSNTPDSQKTMETTSSLIAHALSAEIKDVHGILLATAKGGLTAEPVPAEKAAPRRIHPAEVALLSCAVAEDVEDEKQPVHLFNWQRHLDIFVNGWKAGDLVSGN